jgi:protein MAK11
VKPSAAASTSGFSLLFTSQAHIGSIKSLAVAADGRWMVSGGSDESVRIYATARMQEHGSLIHHAGSVTAAQFFGSAFLLSGGSEGALCIWNTKDWSLAKKFEGAHRPGEGSNSMGGVTALAVHPSGRVALSVGSVDRQCKLWDLMKGTLASSRQLEGPPAHSVAWSPSGESFVLVSDRRIDLYSVASNALVRREELNDTKILSLAFLTDDALVLGCEDKTIRVHSTHTGECITTLRAHGARVRGLDVLAVPSSGAAGAPLIHLLGSASTDGQTNLWDLTSLARAAAAAAPSAPSLSGHAGTFHPIASKSMDHRVVALRFLPHWRVRKEAGPLKPVQTKEALKKQQEMMDKKQHNKQQQQPPQQQSKPLSKAERLAAKQGKSKKLFEKTQAALLARKQKEAATKLAQKKANKASFEVAPLEQSDDEDATGGDNHQGADEDDDEEEEEEVPAPPAKRARVEKQAQQQKKKPQQQVQEADGNDEEMVAQTPKAAVAAAAKHVPSKHAKSAQPQAPAAKKSAVAAAKASSKAPAPAAKAKPAATKPAAAADSDDDDDDAGFQAGLPLFRPQLKQMQRKHKSQRKIQRDADRSKKLQER